MNRLQQLGLLLSNHLQDLRQGGRIRLNSLLSCELRVVTQALDTYRASCRRRSTSGGRGGAGWCCRRRVVRNACVQELERHIGISHGSVEGSTYLCLEVPHGCETSYRFRCGVLLRGSSS